MELHHTQTEKRREEVKDKSGMTASHVSNSAYLRPSCIMLGALLLHFTSREQPWTNVFEYEQQQRGRDRDVVMVRALHAFLFLHGSYNVRSHYTDYAFFWL